MESGLEKSTKGEIRGCQRGGRRVESGKDKAEDGGCGIEMLVLFEHYVVFCTFFVDELRPGCRRRSLMGIDGGVCI